MDLHSKAEHELPEDIRREINSEIIEQIFFGTTKELFIYLMDFIPRNQQNGLTHGLELYPKIGSEDGIHVLRYKPRYRIEDRLTIIDFDEREEGYISFRVVTANPPRSRWVCRAYTQNCSLFAADLGKEILRERLGLPISGTWGFDENTQPANPPLTNNKNAGESESDNLKCFTLEQKRHIDGACVAWAGRGYLPNQNMDEFLSEYFDSADIYLTKGQFKKALIDAAERGLIIKDGRYWKLPPKQNLNTTS